jgi:AcrR family transcriptional regulator
MSSTEGKSTASRQWSRTAETRSQILDAAREVFTRQGFADANVANVVEQAGSSVGSIYHHFGGKAELFIALWEDHQRLMEERSSQAVAKAKKSGTTDPLEMFSVGARAYFDATWERRDLARLFMDGNGPPGFELMRRRRSRDWFRKNAVLLNVGTSPTERMLVAVFTSIIGEAAREIIVCNSKREANKIAEAALRLTARLDPRQDD